MTVFRGAGISTAPRKGHFQKGHNISLDVTENYAVVARPPTSLAVIVISAFSRREIGQPVLAF